MVVVEVVVVVVLLVGPPVVVVLVVVVVVLPQLSASKIHSAASASQTHLHSPVQDGVPDGVVVVDVVAVVVVEVVAAPHGSVRHVTPGKKLGFGKPEPRQSNSVVSAQLNAPSTVP